MILSIANFTQCLDNWVHYRVHSMESHFLKYRRKILKIGRWTCAAQPWLIIRSLVNYKIISCQYERFHADKYMYKLLQFDVVTSGISCIVGKRISTFVCDVTVYRILFSVSWVHYFYFIFPCYMLSRFIFLFLIMNNISQQQKIWFVENLTKLHLFLHL